MEDVKTVVVEKPIAKKVKKVEEPKAKVAKKPVKRKKKFIREVNLARGFLITGLLGIVFFGLMINGHLDFLPEAWQSVLSNEVELLQTSAGLFLIGLFSYTRK
jgi:hypothetical protein